MKRYILIILLFHFFLAFSQTHNLKITVNDLPEKEIYLANFYGDKNSIIDTVHPDTSGYFSFTMKEDYYPGMYRLFLDKDVFFDIIYNREDIEMETYYEFLYDSLKVIASTENILYYDFLRTMHDYRKKFDLLAPLNDYYPRTDTFFHDARAKYIGIQADIQIYLNARIEQYSNAWVTKLMKLKKPLFYDPSLDDFGRREFTIDHYFDNIDFTDVELIRSNVYSSIAIEYMSLYSNPNLTQELLENEFIKAVDKIMYEAMDNSIIYEFIVDYLVGGFERFHFDKVLDYIAENYSPEQCENEERKTDLQTRLKKYAELAVGKSAPGIKIPDSTEKIIKLSDIRSKYTLLIFWASWCSHCNEVLPKIHNIYQNSVDRNTLEVMSISLDTEKDEW
ncbi:MAG: redoxin domain-containing protein, partial [Bacteroidales bacterium]|nr:redoxin domain-containing protein [Bacteroidales bacterium]